MMHFACDEFFIKLDESGRQEFTRGFYDTVAFDDRDKEVGWGFPWLHGIYDEEVSFVGNTPYDWGVQYAIQMQMRGWPGGQAEARKQ